MILMFIVLLMFFGALGLGWVVAMLSGFTFLVLIVVLIIAVFRLGAIEKLEGEH